MIAAAQIRAARALIGVSAAQLAEAAGVTLRTVQRFESFEGIPPSRGGSLERVQKALVMQGIEFIGDPVESPGVRLRNRSSEP